MEARRQNTKRRTGTIRAQPTTKMNLNHPSETKKPVPQMLDKDFQETLDKLNEQRDVALTKLHKATRVEQFSDQV